MSNSRTTVNDEASLQCPSQDTVAERRNELEDKICYDRQSCTPQDWLELDFINAIGRKLHPGKITAGELRSSICRHYGLSQLGADSEAHFAEVWNRVLSLGN